MKRFVSALSACLVVAVAAAAIEARQVEQPGAAAIDQVFARWTSNTPGCAVGVSEGGKVVFDKAYGMADLEHGAPNAAGTIFEAGSVSKQFTAAAILLLAREGRLSLDDPVRKYIPELPDYGEPLLIRHMLQHTSGLRDWGEVEAIAGWPRTTRVYTQAHVLDIASRQKALNFEPGTRWSYSNTGYNLAAIIVSRVSGQPFPEFCRRHIFEPLGMTHTSWRDDFRRTVKSRAIAYDETKDGAYREDMPFENVYGNGGLLTTVGDLLRWNENAVDQKVGDAEFLREELHPGQFNDGTPYNYAMGLYIRTFMGTAEVSHSGSTAGYRAFLARYPAQRLSVAVLCNVSSAATETYAHAVAALYLGAKTGGRAPGQAQRKAPEIPDTSLESRVGLYRSALTGLPIAVTLHDSSLSIAAGTGSPAALQPLSASKFRAPESGRTYEWESADLVRATSGNGAWETYERVERAKPGGDELRPLAGTYVSDEAEVELTVTAKGRKLRVFRRPNTTFTLTPAYRDAFLARGLGLVRFRRDAAGAVTGLSVTTDRVWDLRFAKRQ